jgi:hypothetical protein
VIWSGYGGSFDSPESRAGWQAGNTGHAKRGVQATCGVAVSPPRQDSLHACRRCSAGRRERERATARSTEEQASARAVGRRAKASINPYTVCILKFRTSSVG